MCRRCAGRFTTLLLTLLVGITADASALQQNKGKLQKKARKHAEKACKTTPLAGSLEGARVSIEGLAEKLSANKASLNFEKYRQLSQALEGYTAQWESHTQSVERACRLHAECSYYENVDTLSDRDCSALLERLDRVEGDGRAFIAKMERLAKGQSVEESSTPLPQGSAGVDEGQRTLKDGFQDWPGRVQNFDESGSEWELLRVSEDENLIWDREVLGKRYRWTMEFKTPYVKYLLAPEAAVVDFFLSVDIFFSDYSPESNLFAGLLFGHTEGTDGGENYQLFITTNSTIALSRSRGQANDWILTPREVQLDTRDVNKLGLVVENGRMRFFVNGADVGEWRDPEFTGGYVGLLASSHPGRVVVEFDDFELRRPPIKP